MTGSNTMTVSSGSHPPMQDSHSQMAMENRFPRWVRAAIKKFLLDKSTGNVTLNIKDGRILGMSTETYIKPPKT